MIFSIRFFFANSSLFVSSILKKPLIFLNVKNLFPQKELISHSLIIQSTSLTSAVGSTLSWFFWEYFLVVKILLLVLVVTFSVEFLLVLVVTFLFIIASHRSLLFLLMNGYFCWWQTWAMSKSLSASHTGHEGIKKKKKLSYSLFICLHVGRFVYMLLAYWSWKFILLKLF